MPQKKNPDGLELARSRSALVSSSAMAVKSIIRSLPSGYNRDFQDTKEPLMQGTKATWQLVAIMDRMLKGLVVHEEALSKACVPSLYATDVVLARVLEGGNFRDIYKDVGLNLSEVEAFDPVETLKNRTSMGTSGNLGLDDDLLFVNLMLEGCDQVLQSYSDAYENLCGIAGIEVVLY